MDSSRTFSPPDGGYGWIIIVANVLINSSLTPLMQCFGLIYESQFHEMGISATEISFLLHLHNSIMCSLGLLSGPLLKKYNFRQTSLCGCFLVCLGITITSFASSYGHLIVTICVLIGIGQGILMPSTALAVNTYFKKRLTLAMSYSVTGVGLLPIVMPQVCDLLLNLYGTQGTVLILGALSYHSFIGALLLRPLRGYKAYPKVLTTIKEEAKLLEEATQQTVNMVKEKNVSSKPLTVYNETTVPKERPTKLQELFAMFNLELFRERAYVMILVGMGISYVAELNFVLMTPFVLSELAGFSRADVALAISIQATADILGRLLIPMVSHRTGWSPKLMYAVSLTGSSIGRTVLAIFCDTKNLVMSCFVLMGLAKGSKAVFQSLILPKYVSLDKLPSAMGFLMVLNGILSLIIGPIIGAVHDVSNSYAYALHAATLLSLFCVILWAADSCERRMREKSIDSLSQDDVQVHV